MNKFIVILVALGRNRLLSPNRKQCKKYLQIESKKNVPDSNNFNKNEEINSLKHYERIYSANQCYTKR
jgi:hypothetical protein